MVHMCMKFVVSKTNKFSGPNYPIILGTVDDYVDAVELLDKNLEVGEKGYIEEYYCKGE